MTEPEVPMPSAEHLAVRRRNSGATRVPMEDRDLDAFYRQTFLPLVRRATWKYGLSKEDARDIVQDAFVLALAKIDASGNPRAWLIQVVDHLALNYRRKAARRTELIAKWGNGSDHAILDGEGGE